MVPAEVRPAPDRSHRFDSLPPESNDFSWRVGRARLKRRRGRMLSRERPGDSGLSERGADAVAVGPGSARRSFYGAGPVGVSAGGSGAGDSTSADPSSTIAASSSASIASSSPSSSSRLVPSISASIAGISSDVETTP